MKQLELNRQEIDVLWSAIVREECAEGILIDKIHWTENKELTIHLQNCRICSELKDKIIKLGVSYLNE